MIERITTLEATRRAENILGSISSEAHIVEVNDELVGALALAQSASRVLYQLGDEKRVGLEQVLCTPNIRAPIYFNPSDKQVPYSFVEYANRCLRAYNTIMEYQEKAQELKRTQEVGEVLGI